MYLHLRCTLHSQQAIVIIIAKVGAYEMKNILFYLFTFDLFFLVVVVPGANCDVTCTTNSKACEMFTPEKYT